jgi:hypothetical protein
VLAIEPERFTIRSGVTSKTQYPIQRVFRGLFIAVLLLAVSGGSVAAAPAGTAFTYQGNLAAGGHPASGLYDFQFSLWDAATEGNSVAGPLSTNGVEVTNGLFTVSLDFGAGVFGGQAKWLQIAVRTNGGGDFTALGPLQPLTASPFALYALNADLSGPIIATNPANQLQGVFAGNGAGLTNLNITAGQLAGQSVSLTNLTLDNSLRIACGDIDAYGINRFGWTHTLAKLSTNGPLVLAVVGNGWAQDSDFGGFVTNLLAYKPLAGYASDVLYYMPAYIGYGPFTGLDTALYVSGDDTNWHGSYFVLTNTGSISALEQVVVSDICGIHYLANPKGGSFALEIRTNGASTYDFTNLDNTWTSVANASAVNPLWEGRTLWWTNTSPVQTQVRVRATSPGRTPIVGHAQWNSTVTNGVVLCQYAHQASGNWWSYTDTNRVFPIWRVWQPDLVLWTGGFDNSRSADLVGTLTLLRNGFPGADVVDVATHVVSATYNYILERQFCFANGIPCFDGQAASIAAWGGYDNGVALGLYEDTAHLTPEGYATFSQLLWSWMGLTSDSPASRLAMVGNGVTTNISVSGGVTLYITNGQIWKVTVP